MDECVIMDEYVNVNKYATLNSLKEFYCAQMHAARRNEITPWHIIWFSRRKRLTLYLYLACNNKPHVAIWEDRLNFRVSVPVVSSKAICGFACLKIRTATLITMLPGLHCYASVIKYKNVCNLIVNNHNQVLWTEWRTHAVQHPVSLQLRVSDLVLQHREFLLVLLFQCV